MKDTSLENLIYYDYAVVESGRKVGAEGLHKLYTKNGDLNKEVFNKYSWGTLNILWYPSREQLWEREATDSWISIN